MDNWLENKKLPYHLVSACGLVHRDGLVLLIQNPKRGWELPGGTVEQGERITEALKREVYEECTDLRRTRRCVVSRFRSARVPGDPRFQGSRGLVSHHPIAVSIIDFAFLRSASAAESG